MTTDSDEAVTVEDSVVFLSYFNDMPDRRQPGKVIYPLNEVLLLGLLAILGGAESFTEIARYGEMKLDFLRRFAPFEAGTPPHDTIGYIFSSFSAEAFQVRFVKWASERFRIPAEVIAIDGKTMRGTGSKNSKNKPVHMVSAFAAQQRLVLAQTRVPEKTNEITAIPVILNLLDDIKGSVITIDAMGCQRSIATQIIEKEADYIFSLKGNQETLCDDVTLFVQEQKSKDFADTTITTHETLDSDHGRIETRKYTVIHDVAWLEDQHKWPSLNSIVIVDSARELADKTTQETRLYITSLSDPAEVVGPKIRAHWAIENSLHWILDVVFHDDRCSIRTKTAAQNFATMQHVAVNILRTASGKDSMRVRRKTASWNDEYLAKLLGCAA